VGHVFMVVLGNACTKDFVGDNVKHD